MAKLRRQSGFTLVEMIISIGIIAIISSSILQLFITASNLNRKSYDIDKCVSLSQSIIEEFKAGGRPSDIKNSSIMNNAFLVQNNKNTRFFVYFDRKWSVLLKGDYRTEKEMEKASAYIVKAGIYPVKVSGTSKEDGLYGIRISVVKQKYGYLEKKTGKDLFNINAVKYFAAARVD